MTTLSKLPCMTHEQARAKRLEKWGAYDRERLRAALTVIGGRMSRGASTEPTPPTPVAAALQSGPKRTLTIVAEMKPTERERLRLLSKEAA